MLIYSWSWHGVHCLIMQRIYAFGARTFMIVNLPPLGCLPALLTLYPQTDSERYDTYGCLDNLNEISKTHNALLRSRVEELRNNYTSATFYLADYYNVYRDVLKSPAAYGNYVPDAIYNLKWIWSMIWSTNLKRKERDVPEMRRDWTVHRNFRDVVSLLRLWRFLQFQSELILHTLRSGEWFLNRIGGPMLEFHCVSKLGRDPSYGADELDSRNCVF